VESVGVNGKNLGKPIFQTSVHASMVYIELYPLHGDQWVRRVVFVAIVAEIWHFIEN